MQKFITDEAVTTLPLEHTSLIVTRGYRLITELENDEYNAFVTTASEAEWRPHAPFEYTDAAQTFQNFRACLEDVAQGKCSSHFLFPYACYAHERYKESMQAYVDNALGEMSPAATWFAAALQIPEVVHKMYHVGGTEYPGKGEGGETKKILPATEQWKLEGMDIPPFEQVLEGYLEFWCRLYWIRYSVACPVQRVDDNHRGTFAMYAFAHKDAFTCMFEDRPEHIERGAPCSFVCKWHVCQYPLYATDIGFYGNAKYYPGTYWEDVQSLIKEMHASVDSMGGWDDAGTRSDAYEPAAESVDARSKVPMTPRFSPTIAVQKVAWSLDLNKALAYTDGIDYDQIAGVETMYVTVEDALGEKGKPGPYEKHVNFGHTHTDTPVFVEVREHPADVRCR